MGLADGHALFVNADPLHAIKIVEDQTLMAAHDDDFADLVGVRPAYVNIPNDFVGVAEGNKGDILTCVSQGSRANSTGPLRLFVEQIIEDGNIVRGQIPDGVDVRANGAEIGARACR